jgi:capsular exopolysaccharide synthesis family protein
VSKFFEALDRAERERGLRPVAPPDAGPAADEPPAALVTTPIASPPAPARLATRRSEPHPPVAPGEPDELWSEVREGGGVDEHLVSLVAPESAEAEPIRALRDLVEQLHRTAQLVVVAISSPGIGDGKTTTAINLAGSMAQAPGARVLLIDADLRQPGVERMLGIEGQGRGVTRFVLDRSATLADVTVPIDHFGLAVVPAGLRSSGPYEILKAPRFAALLEEARRQYDHIVVDTPPLVPLADCRLIERLVDGLLLVVAAHRTPRRLLEEALRASDPKKLVGLVFNRADGWGERYYHSAEPGSNGGRAWGARLQAALGRSTASARRRPGR